MKVEQSPCPILQLMKTLFVSMVLSYLCSCLLNEVIILKQIPFTIPFAPMSG